MNANDNDTFNIARAQTTSSNVISIAQNSGVSRSTIAVGDVHQVIFNVSRAPDDQSRLKEPDIPRGDVNSHPGSTAEREAQQLLAKTLSDWLFHGTNFRAIHIENLEKWTRGTLAWFLESDWYQAWKDGPDRIIWGTGMPGAGKTVLASRTIHDIEEYKAASDAKICIVYAYFRHADSLTTKETLEGFIQQFLECDPSLSSIVEPLYSHHHHYKTRPTLDELLDVLKQLESHFDIVFYVLDGVDDTRVETQIGLVRAIKVLKGKFALTSQPLKRLESGLPSARMYEVVAKAFDIETFVAHRIEENPALRTLLDEHDYVQQATSQIVERSNGMFLHASLQLENLEHCLSTSTIQRSLEQLPEGLDNMYAVIVGRIQDQPSESADVGMRALVWLVFGRECFTASELCHALAICPETGVFEETRMVKDSALISACCGLVKIEKDTGIVQLIHSTAFDALKTILAQRLPNPHSLLFNVTSRQLLAFGIPNNSGKLKTKMDLDAALHQHPILPYSYRHWADHALECLSCHEFSEVVLEFIRKCHSFPYVFARYTGRSDGLDYLSPIHIVARHGFHGLLLPLSLGAPKGWATLRTIGEHMSTPLMIASQYGQEEVVERLLEYNNRLRSGIGCMSLLLLRLGPCPFATKTVNLQDDKGRTALMYASANGHTGIVQRLLEQGKLDPNIRDKSGWTALMHASSEGHLDIVLRLMGYRGLHVNVVDGEGWSAVFHALWRGHEEIVQHLLGFRDVQVGGTDKAGRTALMCAIGSRRRSLVSQILGRPDTEINARDHKGWTALMYASNEGLEHIVEDLLRHADIQTNLKDDTGRTALIFASSNGHTGVVRRLIRHASTLVNLPDREGKTALIHASLNGRGETVEELLGHSAVQVNLKDKHDRRTALMYAARDNHEDAVRALLSHPHIRANEQDRLGWTALMLAARNGHSGTVKPLLQHKPILVNVEARHGWTALIYASMNACEGVAKQLLEHHDIDVNRKDNKGRTALIYASMTGRDAIVQSLVDHKDTKVNLEDDEGKTCLMYALMRGHDDAAQILQLKDAIVPVRIDNGGIAMVIAALKGDPEFVYLLETAGVKLLQSPKKKLSSLDSVFCISSK
ncbi:ankyrin repeat domain-containing protein 50 [Coprinopsis cinerea AmutBmut pab1-1]|nr:ankyrin repeat domain-containing protein 50 [Coprinopsis cinerea AmutBmut pab1-1]